MKPKFILGVGAQRAGTTWLHKALMAQSNVNMGFTKEYHIWDAKFSLLGQEFQSKPIKPDNSSAALRRLMQADHDIYGAYFKGLIDNDVNVTGDITPSYSYLSSEDFGHIKNVLERHGFDVKVIFLLREPVERLWSALRLSKRIAEHKSETISDDQLTETVLIAVDHPQQISRSDYISTMNNLESVFDTHQIHYSLFENLFTERSVERLEGFLEIELRDIDLDEKINASPQVDLPPGIREIIKTKFVDQYVECQRRFPITNVLWPNCP
ncbi:sulfotransferase [Breoghania sp. L-A4]|uniref:sulfotransferase n=1 Tax=Breoghania sp. L-A4 TaxID=2304600 RepID=UPI000E358824|nr:sulfotransferase [Breoghania sp. L-A4]AXS41361.1 hypothetical protein D1F64_16745 [Breoghania sp. L-A4]